MLFAAVLIWNGWESLILDVNNKCETLESRYKTFASQAHSEP
jgi:hypothetical protein